MTVQTFKSVTSRFIKSASNDVLAIKGAWGVGKTYMWNQMVQENKSTSALKKYSYVSLFGISSLRDLRLAVVTKARAIENYEMVDSNLSNFEQIKNHARNLVDSIRQSDAGKNVSVGLETIAPYLLKDTLICLDDFERISHGVSVEEVLGFVSEVKQEKNCKVVLIFNEDHIQNKEVYEKYKEKVIDIEIQFDPSSNEAVEHAPSNILSCVEPIKKRAIALDIKNIRILKRINTIVSLLYPEVQNLRPEVLDQTIHTVVLATWCALDTNENKPTLDFVRDANRYLYRSNQDEYKRKYPNFQQWEAVLEKFEFRYLDDLDKAIINVIQKGYVEETGFVEEAKLMDSKLGVQQLENSVRAAWELFHNSFADNKDQVVSAIKKSIETAVDYTSPGTLDASVRLLRSLKADKEANELIDYYIQNRKHENRDFDLEDYPFPDDISDSVLTERFDQKRRSLQVKMSLVDVVEHIANTSGWSKKHIDVLKEASVDEFYSLFKNYEKGGLSKLIKSCLRFGCDGEFSGIDSNVRAALIRLGKESEINEVRVKRFGIDVNASQAVDCK